MKNVETIVDLINNCSLYNCEDIRCGDALYYLFAHRKNEAGIKILLKTIKKLLSFLFNKGYRFESVGFGDTVFFYSESGGERNDFYQNFKNVENLSQNHILMEPREKKHFDLGRIRYYKEIFKWIKNLKKTNLSLPMRFFVAAYLLDAYAAYTILEKNVDINKINKIVVLCDVHIIDSFFIQRFNHLGKTTITLQHGNVSSIINTWALLGSHSKYFFACNQFSINEAQRVRYRNKMKLVGFYADVGKGVESKNFISKIKTIGIYADGTYDDDNYEMINILLDYCKKSGSVLKIKLHPTNDIEKYKKKYSNEQISFVDKAMSVKDFCNEIDVAILRNSATLIETLQYGVPTYIIQSKNQIADVYKNVDILKFETSEDLFELLNNRTMDDIRNDLHAGRDLFCCNGMIAENYKNAFGSLGIS